MRPAPRSARPALLTAALLLAAPAWAAEDPPAWLRQAAQAQLPAYDREVSAVVLLDEDRMDVDADGRVTTSTFGAVRLLSKDGRRAAVAAVTYATDSGKVRELRAWLIRPSGEVKRYGKENVVDVALVDNDVYNESRRRLIAAGDDADAGSVFGYEAVVEDRPPFAQFERAFQSRLPTLVSRLSLVVPAGWRVKSTTFNHEPVAAVAGAAGQTWELRDLPYVRDEPRSPPLSDLVPRLAVSYDPGVGVGDRTGAAFASWTDVSRWMSTLSDGQAAPDPALSAKARELTRGAATEIDKLRAIARYVQDIPYISIQIGVGRFRPHAAADVFAKAYGDCKDKANLMRAMLAAVGIEAQLVLIFSGDRNYVREEWASPGQFNHCIIAVRVKDLQAPTVVTHPVLGRLLVFDPTSEHTALGDLPPDEQGSLALIVAGDNGALVRMPTTPPETNTLERETAVELSPDGAIQGRVTERSLGSAAVRERGAYKQLTRLEYEARIQRWITQAVTGAVVAKVASEDGGASGAFKLDAEFTAPAYGQLMQGRLLVFRPAIVPRRDVGVLSSATRVHPVLVEARSFKESARFKLPPGFAVDETPEAVALDTPFGTYSAGYEVRDGELVFSRSFVERVARVPVEQYASVRAFYEKIRAAEQAPVVLARK